MAKISFMKLISDRFVFKYKRYYICHVEWIKHIENVLPESREALNANLTRIAEKKAKLDEQRPLPESALQRIKDGLYIEWSYNSNSIEGNTLSLNETRMVLKYGITVKGKSLREHLEITNHEDAILFVEQLAQKNESVTEQNLRQIHEIVMTKIEKEFAGRYRNGMVRIIGANFTPPNAAKISDLMQEYVAFVRNNPLKCSAIEMAAFMHHRFVWIHPFFDGNGRTIRLLMNLFLMQQGFPPAIILRNDRKKYYDALNQANSGKYEKLLLLICQAVERSLDIYLMTYPDSDEYKPISMIVAEEQLPYGEEYISLLARQGKIDAYKEGRNWLTTSEAVAEYVANRKRKRVVKKKS